MCGLCVSERPPPCAPGTESIVWISGQCENMGPEAIRCGGSTMVIPYPYGDAGGVHRWKPKRGWSPPAGERGLGEVLGVTTVDVECRRLPPVTTGRS